MSNVITTNQARERALMAHAHETGRQAGYREATDTMAQEIKRAYSRGITNALKFATAIVLIATIISALLDK